MTAATRSIIKRFSETRRRHPLTGEQQALPQAIESEHAILEPLHARADWVIDTTELNIHLAAIRAEPCLEAIPVVQATGHLATVQRDRDCQPARLVGILAKRRRQIDDRATAAAILPGTKRRDLCR